MKWVIIIKALELRIISKLNLFLFKNQIGRILHLVPVRCEAWVGASSILDVGFLDGGKSSWTHKAARATWKEKTLDLQMFQRDVKR